MKWTDSAWRSELKADGGWVVAVVDRTVCGGRWHWRTYDSNGSIGEYESERIKGAQSSELARSVAKDKAVAAVERHGFDKWIPRDQASDDISVVRCPACGAELWGQDWSDGFRDHTHGTHECEECSAVVEYELEYQEPHATVSLAPAPGQGGGGG